MKPKLPAKYCTRCGAKLILTTEKTPESYHQETGEPNFVSLLECPSKAHDRYRKRDDYEGWYICAI